MAVVMTPERRRLVDSAAAAGHLHADRYAVYLGDCVEVMQALPDASVDFSVYSPPFGGMLYQYSSDPADLSNTKDYAEFFEHYGFVVREKFRLTKPGRMSAVHCTDIMSGMGDRPHLIDFPGDLIRCHEANGWKFIARYFVWKEPLMVRNRTMVKSLHHKTLCEDSTRCSMANADCLLIFRRDGKNAVPVAHPVGLTSYAGSRTPPDDVLRWKGHKGNQIENAYSQWVWRQYASAFWDDVRIDRTLGTGASLYSGNKADKDEPDEKHMHPLQLDVVERAVVLWSNEGETVLTPFMGVGSEVYGAVINGRRGLGVELKPAYFRQAVAHLQDASPVNTSADPTASAPEFVTPTFLTLQESEEGGGEGEPTEPAVAPPPVSNPPKVVPVPLDVLKAHRVADIPAVSADRELSAVADLLAGPEYEIVTVEELWLWADEDGAEWGGFGGSNGMGIVLVLKGMKAARETIRRFADAVFAWLEGCGLRLTADGWVEPAEVVTNPVKARKRKARAAATPTPDPTPSDDPDPDLVAEAYADGGVVLVNPSPHGGTWAWCHVDATDRRVREASGTVTAADVGLLTVSNNVTEFLALLRCLEALPDGWAGKVFTDSGVTLQRFERSTDTRMSGIPAAWVERLHAARRRLGDLTFVLLGGHPSKKELAAGQRKDGKPVSTHNVWCDKECQRRAKELTPAEVAS